MVAAVSGSGSRLVWYANVVSSKPDERFNGRGAHARIRTGDLFLTKNPLWALTSGSTSLADYCAGLFAAFGVLVALRHRGKTGEGQVVELGLYEAVFRLMDSLAVVYGQTGEIRDRLGRFTPLTAPHGQYLTSDGHWIALACNTDAQFHELTQVLGAPELAHDPRFATVAERTANRHVLNATIDSLTSRHSLLELLKSLSQVEVPAGPVNNIADIFADPQFWERGDLIRFEHPELGELVLPGPIPHLSATPARIDWIGSGQVGQSNDEIYRGLLELSDSEISALRSEGVI